MCLLSTKQEQSKILAVLLVALLQIHSTKSFFYQKAWMEWASNPVYETGSYPHTFTVTGDVSSRRTRPWMLAAFRRGTRLWWSGDVCPQTVRFYQQDILLRISWAEDITFVVVLEQ